MLKLINWIFLNPPWWHPVVAYLLGYVLFVTVAILVWSFVYRPKMTSSEYVDRDGWTGEEIVTYALQQGIAWPVFTVIYAVIVVAVGLVVLSVEGGAKLAEMLSKAIPDRPPGFQVRK